jgi:pimeloyl-ACP methyl ester carboxylesterase
MRDKTILFLHGFVSSAHSTKAQYLEERLASFPHLAFGAVDFNPTPEDFTYMTITGRIDRLRQYVLDRQIEEMQLVGSSLGGLVALHYAHRFGGVERMLLLAPALTWLHGGSADEELTQWKKTGAAPVFHPAFGQAVPLRYDLYRDGQRYSEPISPPAPTVIIHGVDDETVPVDNSRVYALTYPEGVRLIEVNAGHDLNGHLDLIWEYVQSFLMMS